MKSDGSDVACSPDNKRYEKLTLDFLTGRVGLAQHVLVALHRIVPGAVPRLVAAAKKGAKLAQGIATKGRTPAQLIKDPAFDWGEAKRAAVDDKPEPALVQAHSPKAPSRASRESLAVQPEASSEKHVDENAFQTAELDVDAVSTSPRDKHEVENFKAACAALQHAAGAFNRGAGVSVRAASLQIEIAAAFKDVPKRYVTLVTALHTARAAIDLVQDDDLRDELRNNRQAIEGALSQCEDQFKEGLLLRVKARATDGTLYQFNARGKNEREVVASAEVEYRRQQSFAKQARMAFGFTLIPNGVDAAKVDQLIEILREQVERSPEIQQKAREERWVIVIVPRFADPKKDYFLQNFDFDAAKKRGEQIDGVENVGTPDGRRAIGIFEGTMPSRSGLDHLLDGKKKGGVPSHELGHLTWDTYPEIRTRVGQLFDAHEHAGDEFISSYAHQRDPGEPKPVGEYFAESVAAYFDRLEERPNARAWLAANDPKMFELIDEIERRHR